MQSRMNEDFVTFKLSIKLKEKGFREECFARYHYSNEAYFDINSYHPNTESIFYCYNNDSDLGRFYIDAPTISQVLNWLRKEKKIYIEIFLYDRMYSAFVKSVTQTDENDLFHKCLNEDTSDKEYVTYEQAALAGIEYVLDNLI